MASYDLKAILGEKLKRLTDKTLKALVDCMCTVGASLCSLDKRVSALESVELPEGGYKPMQEPVVSPSASGTAIQFIESVSQDATGRMTATKKTVRDGDTSQKGVVQLEDSHSSTSTTKAATPNSVKSAYDLANTANTGLANKLDKTGDGKDVTATFTEASSRENIGTGEKLSVMFGKIKKWFSDLGTAAFKNVPASGNASSTEVVLGSDTRLSAGASAVQDVTVDGVSVVKSSTKVAAVPNASTSAKGAVQLAGSIGATVASENNKAATEKAVRDAINALDSRLAPNADMYVAQYGVISEFAAMTNARGDGRGEGKKICVAVGLGGESSGFNPAEAIVPLTYVEFGSGGAVVAFYFNLPRDSYGDVNARGSILQVKCTSAGWGVTTLSPYYADTAGTAGTAGSANTAGSATNATNATNDGAGSEIKSTYVCNAKLVYGGGGTLYPGSSITFLSGATIKSDDATIGNRKYVELTYKSYELGKSTRVQQVGEPYMTYNDPDTYLELSKTAFSIAGRKSQNGYFNALTSQLMGTYRNFIEVDFDYDVVATNSTSSIGVVFCLASTLMEGTPQTTIATNDGRIFAFATVSGQGVGGHLRGHIHITGYLQSGQSLLGYGLCIGARSIYGDYSGTCTLKITNVNIKDSYATYT